MGNADNPGLGAAFEVTAQRILASEGIVVSRGFPIEVGVWARDQRPHKFDLGSHHPAVLVECKAHTWTTGRNAPSAKLAVWNEAMHYFRCAPARFRKIFFVLRDLRDDESLAAHYLKRFGHLVPHDVEIWEYDQQTSGVAVVRAAQAE